MRRRSALVLIKGGPTLTSEEFHERMGTLLAEATKLQLEWNRNALLSGDPAANVACVEGLDSAHIEYFKAAILKHGAERAKDWFFPRALLTLEGGQ